MYISGQGHYIIDLRSCPYQSVQKGRLKKTFEKRSSFRVTRVIWFDLNMKPMPRTYEQRLTKFNSAFIVNHDACNLKPTKYLFP